MLLLGLFFLLRETDIIQKEPESASHQVQPLLITELLPDSPRHDQSLPTFLNSRSGRLLAASASHSKNLNQLLEHKVPPYTNHQLLLLFIRLLWVGLAQQETCVWMRLVDNQMVIIFSGLSWFKLSKNPQD